MGKDDDHDDNSSNWIHRNKYDLNSKIMLTAIISLSVVVVIVTLLHIYARYVLRRRSRQRAATFRQLGFITSAHVYTSEPPKTGLDPSVIASLPIFVFKQDSSSDHGDPNECSVCLNMLEDGEMVRTLPNCKHNFHVECIDKWFNSQSTCPICRTEAKPRLVREPREGVAGADARINLSTAPPLEASVSSMEGTSDGGIQSSSPKINVSSSSLRLSSFRWILTRDRSSQRVHCGQEDVADDLERQ